MEFDPLTGACSKGLSMRRSIGWVAGSLMSVIFAIGLGQINPAMAVSLFNGSILSLDGMDLTVANCTYTVNGTVSGGGCSAASAELVAGPGGFLSFVLDHSGGSALFPSVQGSNSSLELNFNLQVARTAGNTTAFVTSDTATLTISGGGGTNVLTNVTASNSSTAPAFNISLAGAAAPSTGSASFASTTAFTLNVDALIISHDNSAVHALTLNSLAVQLKPAPEPLSIGLFLVGLTGLGVAYHTRV